jgi:hypothetical protein
MFTRPFTTDYDRFHGPVMMPGNLMGSDMCFLPLTGMLALAVTVPMPGFEGAQGSQVRVMGFHVMPEYAVPACGCSRTEMLRVSEGEVAIPAWIIWGMKLVIGYVYPVQVNYAVLEVIGCTAHITFFLRIFGEELERLCIPDLMNSVQYYLCECPRPE